MKYQVNTGVMTTFVQKYFKVLIIAIAGLVGLSMSVMTLSTSAAKPANKGFDDFGYNRTARTCGTCLSWGMGKYNWTEAEAQAYCGEYSNDQPVMKWNKAWDECNADGTHDPEACSGAWLNNEWNGMVPDGSGETEHFKAVWYPEPCTEGKELPGGGYCIWGHYNAIMDFYGPGQPDWLAHAIPNGYGVKS